MVRRQKTTHAPLPQTTQKINLSHDPIFCLRYEFKYNIQKQKHNRTWNNPTPVSLLATVLRPNQKKVLKNRLQCQQTTITYPRLLERKKVIRSCFMVSRFGAKFHLKILTDFVFNFRCFEFHPDSEICDQTWILYKLFIIVSALFVRGSRICAYIHIWYVMMPCNVSSHFLLLLSQQVQEPGNYDQ